MTRILLADDHTFFRSGVEAALRAAGMEVVGSVGDGEAALQAVTALDPDVVILDLNMPCRDGVSTLQALRAAGDNRPVIVLAAELPNPVLLALVEADAEGILLKAGAELHLIEAVRAVERGDRFIGARLDQAIALAQKNAQPSPLEGLSRREKQIASEIALGRRNKEIADRLNMTEGTIKIYLHNIYRRLGVKSRTELAVMLLDQTSGQSRS